MAKTTKKSKSSEAETKKTKTEEPVKQAPPISPGLISIAMLPNDLATLTNLMSICAKIFEEQALLALQEQDEQKFAILSARHKMSTMFADRLVEFCKVGEPESRDMH